MKISIIIVTYNNEKTIQKCLDSLFNSNLETVSLKIEIIDNASQDATVDIIEKYFESTAQRIDCGLKINSTNIGFAGAVNRGIRQVQKNFDPDFFLLLNPDAYLKKDCLQKILNTASKDSLVSPLILDPRINKKWFAGGRIDWLRFKSEHVLEPDTEKMETEYLSGCCLLLPREVIEKIDIFDEGFFLYYEDADFSLRAKKAGCRLKIVSNAVCFHGESESFKKITKLAGETKSKEYHLVKSALVFFYKHYPVWARPYFWLVFWVRYFYHMFMSKKKDVIAGMKDFNKKI